MHTRTTVGLVVALAAALVLSGCTPTTNSQTTPDGTDTTAGSPDQSGAGDWSVLHGLAEIPADLDRGTRVIVADLTAVSAAAELPRGDASDLDAATEWLRTLATGESTVLVPYDPAFQMLLSEAATDTLGFSAGAVETVATATAHTDESTFTVVTGPFDDTTLPSDLQDLGDGIRTDVDAKDLEADLKLVDTVMDPVGRPVRIAQRDDAVAFGNTTDRVRAWLNGGDTLADDPAFADIASAFDAAKVVSATFVEPLPTEAVMDPRGLDARPKTPFDLVGIGWDGSGDIRVAYHFTNGPTDADADALRALWTDTEPMTGVPVAELVTVTDVQTDGSVVTVILKPDPDVSVAVPLEMSDRAELPFVSR